MGGNADTCLQVLRVAVFLFLCSLGVCGIFGLFGQDGSRPHLYETVVPYSHMCFWVCINSAVLLWCVACIVWFGAQKYIKQLKLMQKVIEEKEDHDEEEKLEKNKSVIRWSGRQPSSDEF